MDWRTGVGKNRASHRTIATKFSQGILAFDPGTWPLLQYFPFMPDFDPSSVPMGVDEEVGDTPPGTISAARKIERRRHPLPQLEQGLGDAWILVAFIVALG